MVVTEKDGQTDRRTHTHTQKAVTPSWCPTPKRAQVLDSSSDDFPGTFAGTWIRSGTAGR